MILHVLYRCFSEIIYFVYEDYTPGRLTVAMAATAQCDMSVVELQAEIERLSRELDQASSEKIQSAQLGLVLLEEKSALQQRYDELESIYENTRHDLKITQEVSGLHSVSLFSLFMH